jgi:hypothetical protein
MNSCFNLTDFALEVLPCMSAVHYHVKKYMLNSSLHFNKKHGTMHVTIGSILFYYSKFDL